MALHHLRHGGLRTVCVLFTLSYLAVAYEYISSNTENSTTGASLGTTDAVVEVDPSATYWITGAGPHNWYGSVLNEGTIIVSQADASDSPSGLTSEWISEDDDDGALLNFGTIILNDISATSSATYNWNLSDFTNYGTIQFCGRGDGTGSEFSLWTSSSGWNEGIIVFEQYDGNTGTASKWGTANPTLNNVNTTVANIANNGAFMIRNTTLSLYQNPTGTGCWVIDTGATLWLADGVGEYNGPDGVYPLSNQSISFVGTNSVLHMQPTLFNMYSTFIPVIYGFGPSTYLEFDDIVIDTSYGENGNFLSVRLVYAGVLLFDIGAGYTGKFPTTNVDNMSRVTYDGDLPEGQEPPEECTLTQPTCEQVDNFPTTSAISSTSSVSSTESVSNAVTTSSSASSALISTASTASTSTSSTTSTSTASTATTSIASTTGKSTVLSTSTASILSTSSSVSVSDPSISTSASLSTSTSSTSYTIFSYVPGNAEYRVTISTVLPSDGQPGYYIVATPTSVPSSASSTRTALSSVTSTAATSYTVFSYVPGSAEYRVTISTVLPSDGHPGYYIVATPTSVPSSASSTGTASPISTVTVCLDMPTSTTIVFATTTVIVAPMDKRQS